MALTIISRAGWGAKPPESRTPWNVANLEGICQHWFGVPRAAATHAGCDDLLRGVQRSHQAGEFSDIAYNFGVCPHGSVYEFRGWNTQTGANGNQDLNTRFLAIVYMAGTGDPLTPKGRDALIALYQEAFRKGVGVKAVGHGDVAPTGTQCPGPPLKNFLASGVWRPKPPSTKFRYIIMDGEGKKIAQSNLVGGEATAAVRKERLEKFLTFRVPALDKELQQDRDLTVRKEKA